MEEKKFHDQVREGGRFEFGKNWKSFLKTLTEERIEIARQSLVEMLESDDLTGKKFLDVGCGSGLFSLAAMKLGASVYSFDFDPNSVKCAEWLKQKYYPQGEWKIEEGSVLNEKYISSLGKFDIVYSWGVLHHTGNLQKALENVDIPVQKYGKLFISIYNDQGRKSNNWRKIKKIYNSGAVGKVLIVSIFVSFFFVKGLIGDMLKGINPVERYKDYKKGRGMSFFSDMHDWLGGYPFEVATPKSIFDYFKNRNYILTKLKTTLSLGCNEFVFRKN